MARFSQFDVCPDTDNNCGCPLCDIATDDFNRANETPIASPWSKLSGTDANLTSNVMAFAASARYRHNTAYPGAATESRHVKIKVKFSTAGTVEAMVGLTDDSNYFAAALTYISGGCSYLTAGTRIVGVGPLGCTPGPSIAGCVQIPGITTGEWYTLEVCLIPNSGGYGYATYDEIRAKVTLPNGMQYACKLEVDGPAVGTFAGVAATAAAEVDDFKHTYFRNDPTGEHRTCPNCNTPCLISSDDFTTDEPCLWDARTGSYTVSGGVMTIGATPSVIQHHIFHPFQKTAMIVTVRVKDVAGTTARVYLGSGYAQIEISTNTHRLKLYDNDANLLDDDEDLVTADDSTKWLSVTVCYSRGILSATVTSDNGVDLCADAPLAETESGYWASLGGDSGAIFDDFVLSKGYDTSDPSDSGCDDCSYCPAVCNDCCDSSPAGAYIVDLGVGGWNSVACSATAPYTEDCDVCAAANGEFLVAALAIECLWQATIEGDCAIGPVPDGTGCCTNCSATWIGLVGLALVSDVNGCRWRVTVSVAPPVVDLEGCGCSTEGASTPSEGMIAYYYSDYLSGLDQCNTMPVTLTYDSQSDTFPCDGSLPTTITLDSAT